MLTVTNINEAVIEDAENIFWQCAERNGEPPPAVIIDAKVAPPALRNANGQAGEMLKSMGAALVTYIRGDAEAAVNVATQTLQAIRSLARRTWQETDEHGLERHCYAMSDGTTLAQCAVSGEWEQVA